MASVKTSLELFDSFSKPLEKIIANIDKAVSAMEKLRSSIEMPIKPASTHSLVGWDVLKRVGDGFRTATVNIRDMEQRLSNFKDTLTGIHTGWSVLNSDIKASIAKINDVSSAINKANESQQRFNKTVKQSKSELDKLVNIATQLAATYLSFQAAKGVLGASDTLISTQARLGLIVDEGQSVEQLQRNVYAAAQRARGDFISMSQSVSKLGILAGDVFSGTDEIVAFTELMQKLFKLSGASTMEQISSMYQLTQAMASGRLQGDEFRSIMENAPMLADAIAKYLGVTKGELRDLAPEGKITADVIRNAMFQTAEDINKKFSEIPIRFEDIFQRMKNEAFIAFEPVLKRLNEWLNSEQGVAFVQSITNAFYMAAAAANAFLSVVQWIGNVIYSNWGIIEPIFVAIVSALSLAIIPLLWAMIKPVLLFAVALLKPLLPIMLIGAAIGLLIYTFYRWGGVVEEVIGFVFGLFNSLVAFLYNCFAYFANIIFSVAEFFGNVWRDPVYATKKLFYDLVINVLQYLENLASGIENIINNIPGLQVNITSGLRNLLGRLEDARDSLKTETDVIKIMRLDQWDYGEAFKMGQEFGRTVGRFATDKVKDAVGFFGKAIEKTGITDFFDTSKLTRFGKLGDSIDKIGKVGEVGKIRDTVDISSEDLKLLRELAEMRAIQNFVTLRPEINVQTGDIRETVDAEEVVRIITEELEREIAITGQRVYT